MTGPDAERALQWLCTADVAVEPGHTVYTGLLNSRGTYESDVTVTRLDERSYLVLTSAASTERDKDLIRRNLPTDAYAEVVDVTSAYSVLGVMGPASRALLQELTDADLDEDAFPFGTSREITLGYATVRATRMTYVGELGWELLVPAELTVGVFEDLTRVGAGHGLVNGGYYAIEALRLEKGYRAFGKDLTPDLNPVEAGLRFTCKLDGDVDFLGRAAVEQAVAAAKGRHPAPPRVVRRRGPRRPGVGRRARAPRRQAGRAGHVGGVRRDGRQQCRHRPAARRRRDHQGLAGVRGLLDRHRRHPVPGPGEPRRTAAPLSQLGNWSQGTHFGVKTSAQLTSCSRA